MLENNRLFVPSHKALIRFIILIITLIIIDPLRALVNDSQSLSRIFATIGGEFLYPRIAQSDITVLLIDEQEAYVKRNSWPLPLINWQVLLEQLACLAPRAIAVDVLLYGRKGNWDTFLDTIEDIENNKLPCLHEKKSRQIPVILAKGSISDSLGSNSITEHNLAISGWPGHGYPLIVHGQPSLSYAVLRRICPSSDNTLRCPENKLHQLPDERLDVVWGARPPPQADRLMRGCLGAAQAISNAITAIVRNIIPISKNDDYQGCPFHIQFTIERLINIIERPDDNARKEEMEFFKDKIILIGARLSGVTNSIYSPVHGDLDNVYLHAMALDNLLVFGNSYVKNTLYDRLKISLIVILCSSLISVSIVFIKMRSRFYESHKRLLHICLTVMCFLLSAIITLFSMAHGWISYANSILFVNVMSVLIYAARVDLWSVALGFSNRPPQNE